jgi:hypothetical protein
MLGQLSSAIQSPYSSAVLVIYAAIAALKGGATFSASPAISAAWADLKAAATTAYLYFPRL